jgi:hypothetical protein
MYNHYFWQSSDRYVYSRYTEQSRSNKLGSQTKTLIFLTTICTQIISMLPPPSSNKNHCHHIREWLLILSNLEILSECPQIVLSLYTSTNRTIPLCIFPSHYTCINLIIPLCARMPIIRLTGYYHQNLKQNKYFSVPTVTANPSGRIWQPVPMQSKVNVAPC